MKHKSIDCLQIDGDNCKVSQGICKGGNICCFKCTARHEDDSLVKNNCGWQCKTTDYPTGRE